MWRWRSVAGADEGPTFPEDRCRVYNSNRRIRPAPAYGRAVPDLDLTSEISELFMEPFTVTS